MESVETSEPKSNILILNRKSRVDLDSDGSADSRSNDPTARAREISLYKQNQHQNWDERIHLPYVKRSPVIRPGRNSQRVASTDRVSVLVDADAFFKTFARAAESAQREIWIIGWDTDTRTILPTSKGEEKLGDLLSRLVSERPELAVRVLTWDFAFIYLFEREPYPGFKFSHLSTDRLKWVLDHEHPAFGSHHQKIVVVDDQIAFVGGLDLTQRRWDTPEHLAGDPRRVDPGGHAYGPFHDVQACLEGEAATALASIARERWARATGERVPPLSNATDLCSPERLPERLPERMPERMPERPAENATFNSEQDATASFEKVTVGIARTVPSGYDDSQKPVTEVERLFLDAIESADRFVYIENQYFTSPLLARAIAKRLQDPHGPEFILILPRDQTGWIEETTMGVLRSQALEIVESADAFRRFRAYYPVVPGLKDGYVKVHSKVMIVDDRFCRIGSSNMNDRSMGVDTECDIVFEWNEENERFGEYTQQASQLRAHLLGEHLGVEPAHVESRFLITQSLIATVESYRLQNENIEATRNLVPMHPNTPNWMRALSPPKDWIDPRAPKGVRTWLKRKLNSQAARSVYSFVIVLFLFILMNALVQRPHGLYSHFEDGARALMHFFERNLAPAKAAQLYHFYLDWMDSLINLRMESTFFGANILSPFLILSAMVIGSFAFVPMSVMIFIVISALPLMRGLPLALAGALLSASVSYSWGRYWAWAKSVVLRRREVQFLTRRLNHGDFSSIAMLRLTPIAPFVLVGVVAGGLRLRFHHYLLGTLIGLVPGVAALTLFVHSIDILGQRWSSAAESVTGMSTAVSLEKTILVWSFLVLVIAALLMPRVLMNLKTRKPSTKPKRIVYNA